MPRFPVSFGKRKQAAHSEEFQNGSTGEGSTFRVLDRAEVTSGKGSIDNSHRLLLHQKPTVTTVNSYGDGNIFADMNYNR